MSESPQSASGAPHPAANQPGSADEPGSGAPRPDEGKEPTPGSGGPAADDGPQGGSAGPHGDVLPVPSPGDSAGVTVNSADSLLGSSETSQPIQSTGEMVTEEARQRAAQAGTGTDTGRPDATDSAAPGDSAVPPAP